MPKTFFTPAASSHQASAASTERLLGLVDRGVNTVARLARAMELSAARISQLVAPLLKQKRLTKEGRKFRATVEKSYSGTKTSRSPKLSAAQTTLQVAQAAPVKDPAKPRASVSRRAQATKIPTSRANELVKSRSQSQNFSGTKVEKSQSETCSEPLYFAASDWRDFLDLATLPRKAGCSPQDLARVIYKEAADNACDAGRNVRITDWVDPIGNQGICIHDDGPGLDPELVPIIFSPNRARFSSKHIRRVSRGLLGNGARVIAGTVAATGGTLMVETRGVRLQLQTDIKTGITTVATSEPIPFEPGFKLYIALGPELAFRREQLHLATATIRISRFGHGYSGPSCPWWYGHHDFHRLIQEVQATGSDAQMTLATFGRRCGFVVSGLSGPLWKRSVKDLSFAETQAALKALCQRNKPIAAKRLGSIGPTAFPDAAYAKELGIVTLQEAELPYCIEVWAECARPEQKGNGELFGMLVVNRSSTPTTLHGASTPDKLTIHGCDLHHLIQPAPKPGNYIVTLSVTTPHLPLTSEGKEPSLVHLVSPIIDAISKATRRAYKVLGRPDQTEIKVVAWEIMAQAYLNVSDNNTLPAKARQLMYECRPYILERTGLDSFGDQYFTQSLLPDYIEAYPEETQNWNVVFDARGNATEPHTDINVPLGTIEVRDYLARIHQGASLPEVINLPPFGLFPTIGPQHRYKYAFFVEKEGFGPLLAAGKIAEKYDLLITSTKGLSVTALRQLLDELVELGVETVFVLRDFDISGFSIFGTLTTSSRRYRFTNRIEIVDLGLRLADVQAEELQSEPIKLERDSTKQAKRWESQARTLARHGATREEIEFLRTRRSELNMLTGRKFLAFIERKLAEHGVTKCVPNEETLRLHALRCHEHRLTQELLNRHKSEIKTQAAAIPIPADLRHKVETLLLEHPEWPWDNAVAEVLRSDPAANPGIFVHLDFPDSA